MPEKGPLSARANKDRLFAFDRAGPNELDDIQLLASPSDGGKSTLVSLVNGPREPGSRMLLLGDVNRRSLGRS